MQFCDHALAQMLIGDQFTQYFLTPIWISPARGQMLPKLLGQGGHVLLVSASAKLSGCQGPCEGTDQGTVNKDYARALLTVSSKPNILKTDEMFIRSEQQF